MDTLHVIIISKTESPNIMDNIYQTCKTGREKTGLYLPNKVICIFMKILISFLRLNKREDFRHQKVTYKKKVTAYIKHLSTFHIKCPSFTLKPLPIYGLDFLATPPAPRRTPATEDFVPRVLISPVSIFLPLLYWVPSAYCYFHQYAIISPT